MPRSNVSPRAGKGRNWPDVLGFQIGAACREPVTFELKFHPTRKWRFDVALERKKLAVEIDGGGFVNGRHSRGTGIEKDAEKYAEAMLLGWRVLRCTPRQVANGQALKWVEQLLGRDRINGPDR